MTRRQAGLDAVTIRTSGGECVALSADCTIEDQIHGTIGANATARDGLDIIVSNAAVGAVRAGRPA